MTGASSAAWLARLVIFAGILAFALVLWLQFARSEQPCSMCVYQRLADIAVMVIVTMGFFWQGGIRRGLWILAALYALAGAALAGWQWHLTQMATARVDTCASVQVFQGSPALGGWGKAFAATLSGHGSCALAGTRTLLGWPVTHWSIAFFLGCAVILLIAQHLLGRARS
ncbi:disulfide bond formation protein B [Acidithiobacillus marinus]|uniref:Disulfide bond formation protein B n=1 Tax=Acidithiobacillus marinus TaxID=187490 RepID=A0A2I1DQK7_9PROT|nr:disulfide bond formation protein B [Acidithiobacillus marinus]